MLDHVIAVDDVMRRWRSIRDQYRRERQMRARSGSAAPPKKRKYIYYDRLSFLDGSMDLRQTQSNLTERETGSDSEAVIDPVGVDEEVAGPSSSSAHSIIPRPTAPASQDTAPSVQDPEPPPSAAHEPASQEEQGQSSSPTGPPVSSPQAAVPLPRGRRRREVQATRRDVDAGILNYLSRAATDDGEEGFSRSLARYLRPLPREVRLRVRGCMQILIDLSTPPKNPMRYLNSLREGSFHKQTSCAFNFLNRCRINQDLHHLLHVCLHLSPSHPKICKGLHCTKWQPTNPHSQYGHFSRPSDVGWSQPGFGQHGHFGMGYDYTQYLRQQELQREFIYGQQPNAQYGQGQSSAPQPSASSQAQGQLAQQRPPEQDPELPLSPPPTYRDL
ncbi:uncharacterized protein LOC143809398 [Ranitomeya variabilis]|uniref:uncharacterized protein LOC143809398 n=1 Tax=Ranitomeya variabilis TaxID=490064 RepID=UPI004057A869